MRLRSCTAMALAVGGLVLGVTSAGAVGARTELVSVDSGESQGNADATGHFADVTSAGRWVSFTTLASNLVPGDTNGASDVFVRDRLAGTTERISVDSAESQGDSGSSFSAISEDGRYVAFSSHATNLVPGDTNGDADVFVRDRLTGTTERVGFGALDTIGLSADGRFVVYNSVVSTLVPGDTNDGSDIFVHDRQTGSTERVSVSSTGAQAEAVGESYVVQSLYASISGNGEVVEFLSNANNLVPGDTNGSWDIFVHDRLTGTTERATVDSAGNQSHSPLSPASSQPSDYGSLSFDGRFVAFPNHAPDLVPDDPNGSGVDIFVRDRVAGTTERVSVGDGPGGPSGGPASISSDGSRVAFFSCFALIAGDTNGKCDVYVRDRVVGTTEIASLTASDGLANGDSLFGTIDGSGRFVAYLSFATNLVADDTNGVLDVFITDTATDSIAPTVGTPAFSVNPKSVSESTVVSATAADEGAGVAGGEYFIGDDPGEGSATPMSLSGSTLSATIGTSLAPGVYSVGVRARDGAGNWSEVARAFLVVYDASGGFATGGGWVVPGSATSDPGDLLPGLDGTGKANFGFVVKYQNGAATVPGGNLEFQYSVGDFRLKSTAMEWLVITNGNWAKFQGTATVNGGVAVYPFRVDARDSDKTGTPDRFVIRIWAPGANPDTDATIYKASGDVLGGQVVIHR